MNLAPMNGQRTDEQAEVLLLLVRKLEVLLRLVRKLESENAELRKRVSELEGDVKLADTFRQCACNSEFCNHGAAVLGAK